MTKQLIMNFACAGLWLLSFVSDAKAGDRSDDLYYDPPGRNAASPEKIKDQAKAKTTKATKSSTEKDPTAVDGFFSHDYVGAASGRNKPEESPSTVGRTSSDPINDKDSARRNTRHRTARTVTDVLRAAASAADGEPDLDAVGDVFDESVLPRRTGRASLDQLLVICAAYRGTPLEKRCIRENMRAARYRSPEIWR